MAERTEGDRIRTWARIAARCRLSDRLCQMYATSGHLVTGRTRSGVVWAWEDDIIAFLAWYYSEANTENPRKP